MIDQFDFITLSCDLKDFHREKKYSITEEDEEEVKEDQRKECNDSGKDFSVDGDETESCRGSLLSLFEERMERNVRYTNSCQVPYSNRLQKTVIDEFILYLPNLQSALQLWSQISFHRSQCNQKPREPKLRRRRSTLNVLSTSSMYQLERLRSRVLYLTEFNEQLFSKHRTRKQRLSKQRRSSYLATQIMAKTHVREQERGQQIIQEVMETEVKRRFSVAVTSSRTNVRSPSTVSVRCLKCGKAACSCAENRAVFSAPTPDAERKLSLSSSSTPPRFNNVPSMGVTAGCSPRKRRKSKNRRTSMVEILRPTAIGRLEELGVNQDSSGASIGVSIDPQPQLEEVNTIQRTKRLLPYNHRVMLAASVYLEYIQGQRGLPPQPSYFKTDPYLMRQTYKLALGTFHYIQVIEDLLLDTYFYSSYVQFRQCQSLVAVMLYNLKLLGFKAPRAYQCEFGETVREVQEVHEALLRFKTKFHAAFARCRIKCNAYQEDLLMSNDIRIRYKSCVSTPRHVRVNSLRRNKDQVIMTLENRGYTKIAPLEPWTPFSFYCDPLLDQLLVFSPDSKDDLTNFALVHDGSLLLQDKSTVVAASILHNMISPNGPSSNDDVIVTDIGTGNAACYLAALQSKEGSVLAFGPAPDATEKLLTKSDTLNASNVHIVNEPFLQSSCKDKIFKGVRGILCNPPSSLSGVVDIVELVVEEGEKILPAVAKGPCDTASLPRYVTTQYLTLKHALSFPKVSCVVFFTRSIHPQECEHLIRKVCDELNESSDDSPFRLVPVDSAVRESVLTNDSFYHPLVNMKNISADISSKCLRVMPTAELGGFFVATFQRMAVKSSTILERALEKGTLGGDPSKGSSSAKKHKKNKKAAKKLKGDSAMDPTTASMIKVRGKSRKSAKRK